LRDLQHDLAFLRAQIVGNESDRLKRAASRCPRAFCSNTLTRPPPRPATSVQTATAAGWKAETACT
jgi:hypothetical protein